MLIRKGQKEGCRWRGWGGAWRKGRAVGFVAGCLQEGRPSDGAAGGAGGEACGWGSGR